MCVVVVVVCPLLQNIICLSICIEYKSVCQQIWTMYVCVIIKEEWGNRYCFEMREGGAQVVKTSKPTITLLGELRMRLV